MLYRLAFLLAVSSLIAGCEPGELQHFDHYVLNPEELSNAVEFCKDQEDRKTRQAFCEAIDRFNARYQDIEQEFKTQEKLYLEFEGFYPEIDKKTRKALAQARQYVELKKRGLGQ